MPVIYQYAVKVVAGISEGREVAPGRYWTAINVHNPYHYTAVKFKKRIIIAGPGEKQGAGKTRLIDANLDPGEAFEIDNDNIFGHLRQFDINTEFVKGFVIIETPTELDIVAVYTTGGLEERGAVPAFHTERVTPRLLEIVRWEE